MSSSRPNPQKVLLLLSDRPSQAGGQSMLIRRYRLARLAPESRPVALRTVMEQARRFPN